LLARPSPELIVEDDGPGIPEELRAEVFKRFRRGPNTTRGDGSGLGLAIVEEIVAVHHGEVRLDQPDNQRGLRVSIVFPTVNGSVPASLAAAVVPA
jgi:signal transduction histidine kinase